MPEADVEFKGLRGKALSCVVRSPLGKTLTVEGVIDDISPSQKGDDALSSNPALVNNLWSYAKHEKMTRLTRSGEKRKAYKKAAKRFREMTATLAADIDLVTDKTRDGWCSECLSYSTHARVGLSIHSTGVYLCVTCGSRTSVCPVLGCSNMASRGVGGIRIPKYCAEHRHDIPGFEKASARVDELTKYKELLAFEKRNYATVTRVGGVAAAVMAGTAITITTVGAGLPVAVGGAIGSFQGLSGAAAVSSGLATLGGGSLAAGGLGMAGGTLVVTAGGSALAGGLGASVMSAYVSDDKSFRIEKIRDGDGVAVIVANGFLTEGQSKSRNWRDALASRYPDSPIYEVHWGSKNLKKLGVMSAPIESAKHLGNQGVVFMAKKGSLAAASKANLMVSGPLVLAGLIKNPWHAAKNRADRTGVILASLIARTQAESCVLVGHSLGGRVAAVAAETLGTSTDAPRVAEVHLLGAAIGANGDWRALSDAVDGNVYNYFSNKDPILKYLYRTVQGGSLPVGSKGFGSAFPNIKDINVSRVVKSHGEYWKSVKLK